MSATGPSLPREVGESIWQVEGPAEGPRLMVLGGVHGNELTGIEVVKALREAFETGRLTIQRGALVLALGNLEAISLGTRGTGDRNLNRMFNPERLKGPPDGTYEDSRARVLRPFLEQADVLLDIHSTNIPSVPFVSCQASKRHERVYRWLDCETVVDDSDHILAGDPATTDEFVDLAGGIGICFESGLAADVSRVGRIVGSVSDLLLDLGICGQDEPGRAVSPQTPVIGSSPGSEFRRPVTYRLVERILLTAAGFRWADNVGSHYFQALKPGDLIGYHGDVEVRAEGSRVIVFPSLKEHWKLGEPVCCLAVVDESADGPDHTPPSTTAGSP